VTKVTAGKHDCCNQLKGVIVRGRVIQVQEQRFRLVLDDGPAYLLTLAHDAVADLQGLLGSGGQVVVEFEGEPGLSSGVAHAVRPA
jgi:hypothetical protein